MQEHAKTNKEQIRTHTCSLLLHMLTASALSCVLLTMQDAKNSNLFAELGIDPTTAEAEGMGDLLTLLHQDTLLGSNNTRAVMVINAQCIVQLANSVSVCRHRPIRTHTHTHTHTRRARMGGLRLAILAGRGRSRHDPCIGVNGARMPSSCVCLCVYVYLQAVCKVFGFSNKNEIKGKNINT